jgi:hypothetical protein
LNAAWYQVNSVPINSFFLPHWRTSKIPLEASWMVQTLANHDFAARLRIHSGCIIKKAISMQCAWDWRYDFYSKVAAWYSTWFAHLSSYFAKGSISATCTCKWFGIRDCFQELLNWAISRLVWTFDKSAAWFWFKHISHCDLVDWYIPHRALKKATRSTSVCIRKHNWTAYRREAQFDYSVLRHIIKNT